MIYIAKFLLEEKEMKIAVLGATGSIGSPTSYYLAMQNLADEILTNSVKGIAELVKAYDEISSKEAYVSADIFGWAASSISDEGIGQHWESLVTTIDYSCPGLLESVDIKLEMENTIKNYINGC